MVTYIAVTEWEPTSLYRPDNWATLSVAIGATILTLVGIITSILTSNENDRRVEFIENLSFILSRIEEKAGLNPDRSFVQVYNNSTKKIRTIIDGMSPLKYSESIIGILSFYFFVISALLAIFGYPFKSAIGNFILGMVLLAGYVTFVIEEFIKIDLSSVLPKKKGDLTLLTVKLNGKILPFEMKDKKAFVKFSEKIRRIEFKVRFKGQVKNGFLHAIIRYKNGLSSHIPDSNTYLSDFGFSDGYILTLFDRRLDTGVLQNDEPRELSFDECRDLKENHYVEMDVERLGKKKVYRYCSIPEEFDVDSIEIRVYEDPFLKSAYKRREIDCIILIPQDTLERESATRAEMDEASRVLRQKATLLSSRTYMIRCYRLYSWLKIIPKKEDINKVGGNLIALSNSVGW